MIGYRTLAILIALLMICPAIAEEVTNETQTIKANNSENLTATLTVKVTHNGVLIPCEICIDGNCTESNGTAIFDLPLGNYTINVTHELVFNQTFINLTNDTTVEIDLNYTTVTIRVVDSEGNPIDNATVVAGNLTKLTNESGFVNINTTKLGFNVTISKEGYVSKTLSVSESNLTVILLSKTVTFYLGTDENYEILKELENETQIEVYKVGEAVDFANKTLIFVANVNDTVCSQIANETNATIVSFNASIGYTDENISKYWVYDGKENLRNLISYLRAKFFGENVTYKPPKVPENRSKIVFVLDENSKQIPWIINASKDLYVEKNLNVTVLAYSGWEDLENKTKGIDFSEFDVIFLYMLGYPSQEVLKDKLKGVNASVIGIAFTDLFNITNVNLSDSEYKPIVDYWNYGGTENFKRLMIFLGVKFCKLNVSDFGVAEIPPPIEIPPFGIYHPDARKQGAGYAGMGIFKSVEDYLEWYKSVGKWKDDAPIVGIHYYYVNDPMTYPVIDSLIRKLESLGANVIFTSFSYKDKNSTKWFSEVYNKTGKSVDVLITLTSFRLWYHHEDKGIDYLKELNVTPMKAIMEYYYNVSEWENASGLAPSSIAWQIALPELDGLTEFIIVGAKNKKTKEYEPIDYQIDWIAKRAIKWAELHRKPNNEKKIAVIYYNHGGGKDNIGASYLDVPASLEVLLKAMKERGYNVNTSFNKSRLIYLLTHQGINIGTWKKEEIKDLLDTAVLIPVEKYESWFNELPKEKKEEVIKMWGEPPGDIMVYENESGKYIVIPVIKLGNVILAPQPTRGYLQDQEALYHDKELPPHHQYIAFYFWLAREFKADAIVHFGTHGTQEWLPGKETGLSSKDCWPAILIQDVPVVYPYIMDNVGEGTQAKRRGQAVIVDHLTPPMISSGLYGNLSILHEKIHEYEQAQDEAVKKELRKTIEKLYYELELDKVLGDISGLNETEFDKFLENELHEYLHELADTVMPYGLHILGTVDQEHIVEFVKSMLGEDFKENVSRIKPIEEPEDEEILYKLIEEVIINGTDPVEAQKKLLNATDDGVTHDLNLALKYYHDLLNCTREIPRILNALEGRYIPPKIGGDPIRKPDALPTGNNFYSFDPRTIPTKEAWEVAKSVVDDLIRRYYEEHGEFPEKISYVLWATETMRNYGVMQAAVLYTMGVKPVWDKRGRVKDIELIPLDDLKLTLSDGTTIQRPRIDVLVVSSGLHRDTFPMLMRLIDKAVKMVIEEGIKGNESPEQNYVYKHYLEIKEELLSKYNESVADSLAKLRIFAPCPGNYGTGLPDVIAASDTWEDEGKLAEYFINRMGFAYGEDVWGIEASDIFRLNLKDVKVAVHSDTSNLYGVLDNDDYFQFLGGIALAVRHLTGETPDTFVFNLRNPDKPEVQTLSEFLVTELYTRYFNPKWIEGMMEHDYAGAREMMKVIEYLWGWEVTMPDLISDEMWNKFYDIYVQDKYNLGLKEFFEKNPYAKQSIVARMLEAIRKGYWNAPEEVKRDLAKELERLQQTYGFTCCHHTCGNIKLREFKAGILSSIKEEEKKKETTKIVRRRHHHGGGGGGYVITPTTVVTTTPLQKQKVNESGGVGLESPKKPEQAKKATKEVKGYKIEEVERAPIRVSATPIVVLIVVALAVVLFYIGMRRGKR